MKLSSMTLTQTFTRLYREIQLWLFIRRLKRENARHWAQAENKRRMKKENKC